jgi:ribosomal protein L11 methyltransferase
LVQGVVADGMTNPSIQARAPYDLIVANILAGPLTRLARDISAAVGPRGTLVLSGLLRNQEKMVLSFYHVLRLTGIRRDGPWSALVLRKPG